MSKIYCAFCYLDRNSRKLTPQEILTSGGVNKAFIVGLDTEARAKAYELAKLRVGYAMRLMDDKLAYRYGYFSVEFGDVRQEGVTLTKEFERGDAML